MNGKPRNEYCASAQLCKLPFARSHAAALIGAEGDHGFPDQSNFSRSENIAVGIVPHQFGYPTKTVS